MPQTFLILKHSYEGPHHSRLVFGELVPDNEKLHRVENLLQKHWLEFSFVLLQLLHHESRELSVCDPGFQVKGGQLVDFQTRRLANLFTFELLNFSTSELYSWSALSTLS